VHILADKTVALQSGAITGAQLVSTSLFLRTRQFDFDLMTFMHKFHFKKLKIVPKSLMH